MERTRLSAIEFTVLGIAWKRGPCTTYGLMKELSSSTSTYYKKKAGTAYPLVDRLIQAGLLEQATTVGARGEKLVNVTPKGIDELKQWVSTPLDIAEIAHTADFLRLRVFYLGVIEGEQRLHILDKGIETLREQRLACEKAIENYREMGDTFSELATLGVVHETNARIDWLLAIRDRVEQIPAGKP